MPTYDVCGVGCCAWDFVSVVDRYPGADEKVSLRELKQMGGGLAATAMSAVVALGGRSAIFGIVGDDDFGAKILDAFRCEGVAIHGMQVQPGVRTHFAFCVAERGTGHRAIFYMNGSYKRMEAGDLDVESVCDCRALLIDHHHLWGAVDAARHARERGIPIVGDIERQHEGAQAFLETVTHPIVPERFVQTYTGQEDLATGAGELLGMGAEVVVVTQGSRGATAFTRDGSIHQPAFHVEPVVDTTGAGDVYHGAFAYGLALGYDLERNLAFAAAAAALSCRGLGGRGALPTMAEVEALLRNSPT
ncbi:MAG: sugar kinase [Armatimonadetes bacterium]|nr:sugar kinase [Armatimonadota bacterium]